MKPYTRDTQVLYTPKEQELATQEPIHTADVELALLLLDIEYAFARLDIYVRYGIGAVIRSIRNLLREVVTQ